MPLEFFLDFFLRPFCAGASLLSSEIFESGESVVVVFVDTVFLLFRAILLVGFLCKSTLAAIEILE